MTFDENGAFWLSQISYIPQKVDIIINKLLSQYCDVTIEEFKDDFMEFLNELIQAGFVDTMDVQPPRFLYLELTQICNERCIHCYIPEHLKNKDGYKLKLEEVKKVISDFSSLGGEEVIFTGGEIGLYDQLFNITCYAKQQGLRITLLTNGTLFSDEEITELKTLNVDSVQVSLYSLNEDSHDEITRLKGSFKKTMDSIIQMKKNGIPVEVACVVMKHNREDIVDLISFCNGEGLNLNLELNVLAQSNRCTSNLECRLSLDEYKKFIEEIYRYHPDIVDNILKRNDNIFDKNFNFAEYLNKPLCRAGFSSIYIDAQGNVIPCGDLPGIRFGNIYDETFSEIWQNSQQINTFRLIREKDLTKCVTCELSNYCQRCMARNYTECGGILEISTTFCKQAEIASRFLKNIKDNEMKTIVVHKETDGTAVNVPIDIKWDSQYEESSPSSISWIKNEIIERLYVKETIKEIKELIETAKEC